MWVCGVCDADHVHGIHVSGVRLPTLGNDSRNGLSCVPSKVASLKRGIVADTAHNACSWLSTAYEQPSAAGVPAGVSRSRYTRPWLISFPSAKGTSACLTFAP